MSLKQRIVMLVLVGLFQILHLISSLWLMTTVFTGSVSRSRKITLSYDQLGNATMGGDEDETISSMLGRKGKPVWLVKFVNWMFFVLYGERNHCQSKVEARFKWQSISINSSCYGQ